ncbi:hypothetical protein EOD23_28250, partial [Mesorhizobium sp. USDA-HM6]
MTEMLGNSGTGAAGRLTGVSGAEARYARSRLLRGGRMTKWKGEAASQAPHVRNLVSVTTQATRSALLTAALLVGLGAVPAAAADLYWDVNNSGIGIGGTGTWNTGAPSVWNTTGNDVAGPFTTWNNANLDNAIFSGTAGTVTLGTPITVHNLTFLSNGYVLSGGTLTLAGVTPTINTGNGAVTQTINSTIAGAAGLTKAGTGSLVLNGNNTFTGDVTVNAGALVVNASAALGNVANMVNLTGSTLNATGSLSGRTVNLSGNNVITGAGVGSAFFTGSGGLTATGNVTLNNDANNYTGTTGFSGSGTYNFTSIADLGIASSLGAPTTVANGTITIQGASQATAVVNYTGDGDSSNRNWNFNVGAGPDNVTMLRNVGTGKLTLTGNIALGGGSGNAAYFDATSAGLDLLGVISSNNGRPVALQGAGGNTITVGSANTYSGATSINGNVIVVADTLANSGVSSSFGTGSSTSITTGTLSYTGSGASSNRTWSINNGTLSNNGGGALTLSGGLTVSNTATLGGSFTGADNVWSGVISGAGSLRSNGAGTWVLTGANTYTGRTIVDGGTLRAGSATAFGTLSGITTTGGTLDLNGFDMTTTSLTGTGGTIALGSGNLSVNLATGVNNTYGGSISGVGGLTKLGGGTLTLSGANGYTGATTINGGTLALNFAAAGAPASDIIDGASTLVMNGGTLTVTGKAGTANAQTFAGLDILAGNNTVSATSGSSGGSLTVNLGGITRTGGLANFVLPTVGAITTSNADGALGGWATVNGSDYAKVQGGNIVAFTAADYVNKDNAATWLANEIISDAGGAANTPYFGTVGSTVQIGGLQYTAAANSTITVASGQTLGVDGTIIVAPSVGAANQTITGGSMTGTLGGGVLGIQQNGAGTFTIASSIVDNTGAIGFTKAGTGKVVLSGSSTYTGATTVAQGMLSINSVANAGQASAIGAASTSASNLAIQGATLEYT